VSTVLKLTGIKKSYDEPVVDGSFEMDSGEQVALVGPSGSGKSTLLHLISGILRPDEGTITLQDQEITQLSEAKLDRFRAQKIGYVFQSFHLLDGLTVLENVETAITFAGGSDYPRARQILSEMGLEDRLDFFPPQLSVGQRQRVAVARAVVNEPPLVLADEPTANLDPPRAREVLDLIRDTCNRSGAALLVVSHDRDALAGFDRVIDYAKQFKGLQA
jgi:ABC-type lipoprotein export system ATPase subunit